jgi:hypothetical protein
MTDSMAATWALRASSRRSSSPAALARSIASSAAKRDRRTAASASGVMSRSWTFGFWVLVRWVISRRSVLS